MTSRLVVPLSPVTRLPPEILVHIFKLVAWSERPYYHFPSDEDRHTRPNSLGWLRITHVNRTWRAICLGSPDLWALHIGSLPRAALEFLERAGGHVPLEVSVEPRNPLAGSDTHFESLVAGDLIGRMRKLIWYTPRESSIRLFATALRSTSLPLLDALVLEYEGDYEPELFHEDSYDAPIDAPNATNIVFTNCFVPFVAPKLTHLDLTGVDIRCPYLFDVLRGCPALDYINLVGDLFIDDLTDCAIVSLPNLGFFCITGFACESTPPYVYKDIMDHLQFPSSTQLVLSINDQPGHPEEFDYIAPAMRLLCQEDPPTRLKLLHHGHADCFDLKFTSDAPPRTFRVYGYEYTTTTWKRAEFRRLSSASRFVAALQTRLAIHAELAHIVEFSVPMDTFDAEGLTCIFRALPSVHTLHLGSGIRLQYSANEPVGCFKALAASAADTSSLVNIATDASYTSTAVLPRLRHLLLAIESFSVLDHLTSVIGRRAQLHASVLHTLRLYCIGEPKEGGQGDRDARVLRGLVDNIIWKGGRAGRSAHVENTNGM